MSSIFFTQTNSVLISATISETNFSSLTVFKLQQEAPKSNPVLCNKTVEQCPPYYGREYHGPISHKVAASLLHKDGDYLIRLSPNSDNFYTLSLK